MLRGGSFNLNYGYARCAYRYWNDPHDWFHYLGFRVVVRSPLTSDR